MTSLQKKLLIVIGILSLCMCTLAGSLYMASKVNPNQLHVQIRVMKILQNRSHLRIVRQTIYLSPFFTHTYKSIGPLS